MHTDTAGVLAANPLLCGVKTYTTNQTWATVVAPANPLTQPFQLQINTNQFVSASVSLTITIKFANTAYTSTITKSVIATFVHPCKQTVITTSQTIPTLTLTFGDTPVTHAFSSFANSVAT